MTMSRVFLSVLDKSQMIVSWDPGRLCLEFDELCPSLKELGIGMYEAACCLLIMCTRWVQHASSAGTCGE